MSQNERREYLLKQIDIAEQDLLELEREFRDEYQDAEICQGQYPKSTSIKLQEWRIEKLYNQLKQLNE